MKRVLYLLLVLAAVVLVVWLGYLFRYREPAPVSTEQAPGGGDFFLPNSLPAGSPIGLPAAVGAGSPSSTFGLAADAPAIAYFTGKDSLSLVAPDGRVLAVRGGQSQTLSGAVVDKVIRAAFSHDGTKVLVSFGESASAQTSVFDMETRTWHLVPGTTLSAVWSPSDKRIAYVVPGGKNDTLTLLNTADEQARPQAVLAWNMPDADLAWATSTRILVQSRPSGLAMGSLWSVNPSTKTITVIVQERLGLDVLWNADYNLGLGFTAAPNQRGGSLRLFDAAGKSLQELNLLTLPRKCGFYAVPGEASTGTAAAATPYLVCGIPRERRPLEIDLLPDSYLQGLIRTEDDLYRVNLRSGSAENILPQGSIGWDVVDVKVSGDALFFRNRYDNKIYWVRLPQGAAGQ